MPNQVRKTKKGASKTVPAMPLRQFQVVETRDGKDWVMYALDGMGEMWFRYWREDDAKKDQRYVGGKWDPDWRPLDEDRRA